MNAINVTHPEWVEIVSWNDFIEGTYVTQIDDPSKDSVRQLPRPERTSHATGTSKLFP
ncbi:hypothetical protein [Tunturiibacter lichenicola]|jgi:hypothetical protein|uniref:hypothetical protein n=1 Tax=Tunturiibacter lichenicola TaxID=2051959 RepID=UPI003D9B590B